jgi:ribosomal protein L20A (L18A)
MSKYYVIVQELLAHYYTVEANSEEEAEDLVLSGDATADDTKEISLDIFEIEEIKSKKVKKNE